jgi:hypothetical protein
MQCRATSKRTKVQCRDKAMIGRTLCYHHGGASLVGHALPQTTNGKYSKFIPTRLAAKYQAAENDPKLLSLQSELALLDARLADVLARVDTGESASHWQALQDAYATFLEARRSGSEAAIDAAIEALDRPIKGALEDYRAWGHIYTLIEQRRKLAETEHKRLVTSQQMINSTEAMVLIARLTDITSKAVSLNLSGFVAGRSGQSIGQTLPCGLCWQWLGLRPHTRSAQPVGTHSGTESSAGIERTRGTPVDWLC